MKHLIIIAFASIFLIACDTQDGPMEQAGEKIDEQYETVKDGVNQGIENLSDQAEDVLDKTEDQIDKAENKLDTQQ